jgi:hypothetical protein
MKKNEKNCVLHFEENVFSLLLFIGGCFGFAFQR